MTTNPAAMNGIVQIQSWLPYVALGAIILVIFLILLSPFIQKEPPEAL